MSQVESHRVLSAFSPKTQFENLGDALINRELILLAAEHGEINVDLSRCPPNFQSTLGISRRAGVNVMNGTLQLLASLVVARFKGRPTFWFLSPGGYFGEISRSDLLRRVPNFLVLLLLRLLGVRICVVGVSYERLGPRHLRLLRIRSRLLTAHLTRDELSREYASGLGLPVDGVMPDLALNIFSSSPLRTAPNTGRVALCFRADQNEAQYGEVLRFIAWLIETLPSRMLFSVVVQVQRDEKPARDIARFLSERGREVDVVICYDDLARCQAAYAECDIVIGNRLHGLLVGGSQCGKMLGCVSAEVNEKIRGLFDSLAIPGHLVELGATSDGDARRALDLASTKPFDGRTAKQQLSEIMRRLLRECA